MSVSHSFRLGILVNPFAGIGGALALKGSDGAEIRSKALLSGAIPLANEKMKRALKQVVSRQFDHLVFITASDDMGAGALQELGISPQIVYNCAQQQTEGEHTEAAAMAMLQSGIDFLLFAGGDGTARNIVNVVGSTVPVLGVPAGCKIHSGVYAVTPSAAGEVLTQLLEKKLVSEVVGEVRDIDEAAFRQGKVIAKHYGEMRIPHELNYIQSVKMGGQESDELVVQDIVDDVIEVMQENDDYYYVMGSGSTVGTLMYTLNLPNTLLGVDVVYQSNVIASDVNASFLENLIYLHPNKLKLVITVIGGQGHLFGRGNQQLSPNFIKQLNKRDILVLASKNKLASLEQRPLRIDCGNERVDEQFRGTITVITGYHDRALYFLE